MMNQLRVFVASPSDLRPERAQVKHVLSELNSALPFRDTTKLVPYLYEDSAPAVIGAEPQAVVDDFMLRSADADIVVCMLWNRLGTPMKQVDLETGQGYESGTIYELLTAYRHFQQHGGPIVLLYRCVRKADLDEAARVEAARVEAFFQRFRGDGDLRGLVREFVQPDEFGWMLRTDVLNAADRQGRRDRQARLRAQFVDHRGFIEDRLARFVGRALELREVNARISERAATGGYITITGQAGQGKSSVIARLVADAGVDTVAHHFIPINPGPDHQVSLIRNLMARLVEKYALPDTYLASESRPLLRDLFPKLLNEVSQRGGREVLFIDGLDQLQEELTGDRDLSFLPVRLPPGIVCVLGTRPNDALKPLVLLDPHYEYSLPPLSREDFADILAQRGVRLGPSLAEKFYTAMDGNALYLDLVVKELAEAKSVDPDVIIQRLAHNPGGIFSVAIDRLRRQPLWNGAVKPLLGLLAVAEEPLPDRALSRLLGIDGETFRTALQRLGGLLARDADGRCHLYHLKLLDYLRPNEHDGAQAHLFDVDEIRLWHERVIAWCESGAGHVRDIWLDSDEAFDQIRRVYAREHYVTHLFHAALWKPLLELLDRGEFGRAKLRYDPSTRSYSRDLRLGCDALLRTAVRDIDREEALLAAWRYSALRCSLTTKARNYPDELFSLLVVTHRSEEALELVDLMPGPERQIAALCRIAQALLHESGLRSVAPILLRAEEIAGELRDGWIQSRAFHLLLQVCLAGRHWEEAIRVAYRIGDARERVEALGDIAQASAAAGDFVRMQRLLDKCLDLARQIGYRSRLEQEFQTVTRQSQIDKSPPIAFLSTSRLPADQSRAMAFAVYVWMGRGDLEEAILMSERIPHPLHKALALTELARALVFNGNHATARTMLEALPAICERIPEPAARSDVIIAASLIIGQAGDRGGAVDLLSRAARVVSGDGRTPVFDDLVGRVTAVASLSEDVFALGSAEAALSTLEEAVQMTRRSANQEHRQVCLKTIAEVAARIGCDELAGKLLVEAGGAPMALFGDVDLLLESLIRAGNVYRFLDLVVSDSYLKNLIEKRAWTEAIEFARSSKSRREAFDATRQGSDDPARVSMGPSPGGDPGDPLSLQKRVVRSLAVVRALLDARETARARSVVDEILPLLRRMEDDASARTSAIANCAEAVARLEDAVTAVSLIQEALTLLGELPRVEQLDVLDGLIRTALAIRQAPLATSMVERLTEAASVATDPEFRRLALRYAVRAYARLRASARVFEILQNEWMRSETRDEITGLLPLASVLVAKKAMYPGGVAQRAVSYLAASFAWVDEFVAIT